MNNVDQDVDDSQIGDVLGFSVVNQYRCAIKKLLRNQRNSGVNYRKNDDIDSECID